MEAGVSTNVFLWKFPTQFLPIFIHNIRSISYCMTYCQQICIVLHSFRENYVRTPHTPEPTMCIHTKKCMGHNVHLQNGTWILTLVTLKKTVTPMFKLIIQYLISIDFLLFIIVFASDNRHSCGQNSPLLLSSI